MEQNSGFSPSFLVAYKLEKKKKVFIYFFGVGNIWQLPQSPRF